eukprot:5054639-Amphidinium_carterae.1
MAFLSIATPLAGTAAGRSPDAPTDLLRLPFTYLVSVVNSGAASLMRRIVPASCVRSHVLSTLPAS